MAAGFCKPEPVVQLLLQAAAGGSSEQAQQAQRSVDWLDLKLCSRGLKTDWAGLRAGVEGEKGAELRRVLLEQPGHFALAVWTFLEAHDFAGKTILPFCTHEGSGLGQSERDIRKLCPGARVLRGLAIRGDSVAKAEKAIAAWLNESHVPA